MTARTPSSSLRARTSRRAPTSWTTSPSPPGDILLLQRETPDAETEAAALKAKARGAKVMLNLAPAGPISGPLIGALDYLCVNEHEAVSLAETLGLAPRDPATICREVGQRSA